MHYHLSAWVGDGHGDPYSPAIGVAAEAEGAPWWAIDLRPDASMPAGRALVACSVRPADETGARYLGDDLDNTLPALVRTRLANDLGLTLSKLDLRRVVVELLADHGREDGTRWRPLRPLARGRNAWEIHLGGLLWSVPRVAGGAVHTESFTAASGPINSTDTDLTWASVAGSWTVAGNAGAIGADGIAYARAEADTAGTDTYAQISLTTKTDVGADVAQGAPVTRFATATNSGYMACRGQDSAADYRIRKTVSGTRTNVSSASTITVALPELLRIEAEGSTIRAKINGTTYITVTDTSITGGTRAGIYGYRPSGGAVAVDDFETGDLGGAPLTLTDAPTGVRASGPAGTVLVDLIRTDTATGTRSSGQPGTLTVGLTHSDTPTTARATTAPEVLLLDVIHTDHPGQARSGGQASALTADLLHADRPAGARLAGPSGSLLIVADLVLADVATMARAGGPLSSLSLSPPGSRGRISPISRRVATMTGGER